MIENKNLLKIQKKEITEHHIYRILSKLEKNETNKNILKKISNDELKHYNYWKKITNKEVKPSLWEIFIYLSLAKIFGLTFSLKLLEQSEEHAEKEYRKLGDTNSVALEIMKEENEHEENLLKMIDEEKLKYVGSIVLGLNDALVELIGSLAGLTFAFQNTNLIAISSLIVGLSASLSMSASEYLSTKAEGEGKNPLKSAFYTGMAYVFTVLILVSPFLFLQNAILSLIISIIFSISIVAIFNFYLKVSKNRQFLKPFLEMVFISLSIALISFMIGSFIRLFFRVDV